MFTDDQETKTIGMRNVNSQDWRDFKAEAARRGQSHAEAFSEMFRRWTEKSNDVRTTP